MHHYILVKIRGTSAADAEETLKNEYLEQYCGDNKPYDYYGDCTLITKDNIDILDIPCKTIKGFKTFFKNNSTKNYEDVLNGIKRDLLHLHYHQYMSLEEAPTFINSDSIQLSTKANDLLNNKISATPFTIPSSPEGMVEAFVSLLIKDTNIGYELRKLSEIKNMINDPTDYDTAFSSYEAFYVDLTSHTSGSKIFYFWCDRHF